MQKYAENRDVICKKYAKNMQKYAKNMLNMQIMCKKYAHLKICKINEKYAKNMKKIN